MDASNSPFPLRHQAETSAPKSTRYANIDIAKGIGIILVVIGHSDAVQDTSLCFAIIYSFHMPLFYFLSGVFMSGTRTFRAEIANKFNHLIRPSLLISFGWIPVIVVTRLFHNHWISSVGGPENFSISSYLIAPLTGITVMGYPDSWPTINWPFVQLWFLYSLFLTSLVSWFISRQAFSTRSKPWSHALGILFMLLLVAYLAKRALIHLLYIVAHHIPEGSRILCLPMHLEIVLITSFFYILGWLLKKQILEGACAKFNSFCVGLNLLACILLFLLNRYAGYRTNLFTDRYDNMVVSTVEAILGIFIVVNISAYLDGTKISSLFTYLGRNSLWILIFHMLISDVGYFVMQQNRFSMLPYSAVYAPVLIALFALFLPCLISGPAEAILVKSSKSKARSRPTPAR